MIELRQVSKYFPSPQGQIKTLSDVNLSVKSGEIFGIIGHSGAGKSTLLRCVNLLERPSTGTVYVDNRDLTHLNTNELTLARRQIGMIFQHFNLLTSSTVYENVILPLRIAGKSVKKMQVEVNAILKAVGLENKHNCYPAQLSGGQKQRVALARALVTHPKVLLCDEATSALDPQTTDSILDLLKKLNQELGLTILLITHEMDVVKKIADKVAVLDQGHIIEQGDTGDIFYHPKNLITKNFVNASLRQELPHTLANQLLIEPDSNTHPVLKILFRGTIAAEPLIANLVQKLNISINILQANIEFLKNDTFGAMVVEIMSPIANLDHITDFLQQRGLKTETMGYVRTTLV